MEGKRGGVFANCAYCNHERKTYIEASLIEIAKYVTDLDKQSHDMFLNLLYKEVDDLRVNYLYYHEKLETYIC
jgi:hypothetical protein